MTTGWILYLLFFVLMAAFWRRARGRSLDALFHQSDDHHHHVLEVLAKHPLGGTWAEPKAWMAAPPKSEKDSKKKSKGPKNAAPAGNNGNRA